MVKKSNDKSVSKEKLFKQNPIEVTSDPRFSAVHNDPRFNLPRRKNIKSNLDSRFKDAINNDKDFQNVETVDKYGRKISRDTTRKELERYYNLDDEEEENGNDKEEQDEEKDNRKTKIHSREVKLSFDQPRGEKSSDESSSEEDEDEEEKEEEEEEEEKAVAFDRARGEGPSESESSSSESDSSSDEEEEDEEDEAGIFGGIDDDEVDEIGEKQPVALGDETSAFAVVNMDWDNIRAIDLMATFSSFVPPRNRILSVTIFPSEYGKQRMAQEELEGPAKEMFVESSSQDQKKKSKSKSKSKHDDEEEINEKTIINEDLGEEVDSSRLRKYQLQRLKYYYAVVKCDKVNTAKSIYDNCDGTEYESTANFFDLRYIPEGMVFDDKPHDECTKIPANYKPNNFVTDALQHSKVKLTWDETPNERLQISSKAFSQKEIDDMDFKAYLASDSEDEETDGNDGNDNDEKDRVAKMRKALLGPLADKLNGTSMKEEKDDIDMEITFTPGLDDGGVSDKEEEEENEETTIDKYRRKEKERRKKRMEKFKETQTDDSNKNTNDDDYKKNKKANKKNKKNNDKNSIDSKKAAELELIMMDDDFEKLDKNRISSGNKKEDHVKKSKKSKKIQEAEEAESGFDIQDDRFKDLFENPEYAIDTTLPQFKKTKAMENVMQERRRRTQVYDKHDNNGRKDGNGNNKRKFESRTDDDNLSSLVEKVKRRGKK